MTTATNFWVNQAGVATDSSSRSLYEAFGRQIPADRCAAFAVEQLGYGLAALHNATGRDIDRPAVVLTYSLQSTVETLEALAARLPSVSAKFIALRPFDGAAYATITLLRHQDLRAAILSRRSTAILSNSCSREHRPADLRRLKQGDGLLGRVLICFDLVAPEPCLRPRC